MTLDRQSTAVAGACAIVLVSLACSTQQKADASPADLLILNGKVYAADGSPGFAEAVAVAGDRILRIGTNQQIQELRGPNTALVDAHGGAVVPGFNDSHVHFLEGGLALGHLDLAGAQTLQEVQTRIRTFAAAHPNQAWVRGRGWLYSPFPGGLPTRQQLDALVADRPAYMTCYDGHSAWVNSKALALAGITRSTPDPKNGIIVKDPKTGEPTGVLKEAAQALIGKVLPQPTKEEQRAALRAAIAEAHRVGVTSVQNASGTPEEFELYDEARRAGDLKVRTYTALSISPGFSETDADRFDQTWKQFPDNPALKTGAVKIVLDGVIESRTAALLAPYTNSASAGTPNHSAEELERIVTLMDRRGWQIWIHAIGDRAVRMSLDAFEHAAAANPQPQRGRRHRLEHIETIDAADIPRFGKLGVIASQQPMHAVLGDMNSLKPSGPWPDNIGPERATRAWAWKSIRDAGGRITFGSDWDVAPLETGQGLWLATTRVVSAGARDQKLTMPEAIDGYTRWAAYASFEEQRKGSLAPGMLADVVVLARDVFLQEPAKPTDIVVETTIFDGKVVYRRHPGGPSRAPTH